MLSLERLLEGIYKNKVKDVEKVQCLEGEVSALREDILKLTTALSLVFNLEGGRPKTSAAVGSGGKEDVS
jgi:hypothetical protein